MRGTPAEDLLTTRLRAAGQAHERGDATAAEQHLLAAWNQLPEPRPAHRYGGALAVHLIELYRDAGRHEDARHWLAVARQSYGPEPHPRIEFLAATVHYAAGEMAAALAIFSVLYLRWNTQIFQDQPPQYLAAVLAHRAGEEVVAEPVPGHFGTGRAIHGLV